MPLVPVFLVPVGVGVLLWLVDACLPMDAKIWEILNIVVVIVVGDSRREVNDSGTSLFQRTTRGKEGEDE